MGFPWDKENIRYLLDNNVYYLISLTEEVQPKVDTFPGNYIINISRGFKESDIYFYLIMLSNVLNFHMRLCTPFLFIYSSKKETHSEILGRYRNKQISSKTMFN